MVINYIGWGGGGECIKRSSYYVSCFIYWILDKYYIYVEGFIYWILDKYYIYARSK